MSETSQLTLHKRLPKTKKAEFTTLRSMRLLSWCGNTRTEVLLLAQKARIVTARILERTATHTPARQVSVSMVTTSHPVD